MSFILLVDDDDSSRELLAGFLEKQGYSVIEAKNGPQALDLFKQYNPSLLILDRMMPGMDGLEVCQIIRGENSTLLTHIIMLTAKATVMDKVEGLDSGANDYITKPFDLMELLAHIRKGIRQSEERRVSLLDGLTQINNRMRFTELMRSKIKGAKEKQTPLCLAFLDLDHFKLINDTYGHQAGDDVLRIVGQLLLMQEYKGAIAGRWGGEEFVLLMPEKDLNQATTIAEELRSSIETQEFIGIDKVTASIGVSEFTIHEEDLVKKADDAVYEAKEGGRNRVVCHSSKE